MIDRDPLTPGGNAQALLSWKKPVGNADCPTAPALGPRKQEAEWPQRWAAAQTAQQRETEAQKQADDAK